MKPHSDAFYTAAIKNAFPDAWDVRTPAVPGGVSPVFLCDTQSGIKVCRFSDYNMILRNHYVGNLLNLYNIPVPNTRVHAYLDTRFESYDYCPASTLYEQIQGGMPANKIFDVYKQATDIQRKIADIAPAHFHPPYHGHMYDVFAITQKMRVSPMLAYMYGCTHRLFSGRGEIRVLHNDIYDKNMLVDDAGKLVRMIDLDSIALCNESFSVMMTLRVYPLENHCEYIEYYEDTMQRKINRKAIMTGLKLLNAIRKPQVALNRLLWCGHNAPPSR